MTFYRTKGSRIIDFEIEVEATAGPVTFHDTKEGMFGLRVASSMDVNKKTGGRITNAEGLTDDKAWGKPPRGSTTSGRSKGRRWGSPSSTTPELPIPHDLARPDYGLFAANPFGWHDFGKIRARATTPCRPASRSDSDTA